MKPFCINFAGAFGSGKTPIAQYLSENLNLPIFSNDSLRNEVREDFGSLDIEVFERRLQARAKEILTRKQSFINDASLDRRWLETKEKIDRFGYDYFVISLDLSEICLKRIYGAKSYDTSIIPKYKSQHDDFLAQTTMKIGLHIKDSDFPNRLALSLEAVQSWLKSIE